MNIETLTLLYLSYTLDNSVQNKKFWTNFWPTAELYMNRLMHENIQHSVFIKDKIRSWAYLDYALETHNWHLSHCASPTQQEVPRLASANHPWLVTASEICTKIYNTQPIMVRNFFLNYGTKLTSNMYHNLWQTNVHHSKIW